MSAPQSMTGFGKAQVQNSFYQVTVELKSVNHRFKDTRFRLPTVLSSLEMDFKKSIEQYCRRGSFDLLINYQKIDNNPLSELDMAKVKNYLTAIQEFTRPLGIPLQLNPGEILRHEFFLEKDDQSLKILLTQVKETFEQALQDLLRCRREEGARLVEILQSHYQNFTRGLKKIEACSQQHRLKIEERLRKSFAEFKDNIPLDEGRFGQEIIYYLEKIDISEEINRLKIHLQKFNQILEKENEIGRHLDFLVQEINRETNTIGSKSSMEEISQEVVTMKVELESIREQIANLE
jgi:uncharacterized protein (TIGR00255 family)